MICESRHDFTKLLKIGYLGTCHLFFEIKDFVPLSFKQHYMPILGVLWFGNWAPLSRAGPQNRLSFLFFFCLKESSGFISIFLSWNNLPIFLFFFFFLKECTARTKIKILEVEGIYVCKTLLLRLIYVNILTLLFLLTKV